MRLPPRIPRSVPRPLRSKRPGDSQRHIDWIKTLPCLVCGKPAEDPHHMLGNVDGLPKGMGRTNEDRWAVPACRFHHDAAHQKADGWIGTDEDYFMERHGIAARELAKALWRVSCDTDAGLRLVYRAKQRVA